MKTGSSPEREVHQYHDDISYVWNNENHTESGSFNQLDSSHQREVHQYHYDISYGVK